jgi:hypothetical protein
MLKLTLNQEFVVVYENAVSADFCDQLIADFEASERRAPGMTGGKVDLEKKRSTDITLNGYEEFHDTVLKLQRTLYPGIKDYMERYCHLLLGAIQPSLRDPKSGNRVTVNSENFEKLNKGAKGQLIENLVPMIYCSGFVNIQKYDQGVGGYPAWHSENYPEEGRFEALHRVLLYMVYLNDVDEGGETEFFYQKLKIKPKKGTLVIAPAAWTHTHRGNTPVSGDKYIATSWIKFQPADVLYGKAVVT